MATICSICCENYNNTSRKIVRCPYCEHESCTSCVKRFILESTSEPHCMTCRHEWSIDFIDESLNKMFRITSLKKHREQILFEKEVALLPTTQIIVERRRRCDEIKQQCADLAGKKLEIDKEIQKLNRTYYDLLYKKGPEERREFTKSCPAQDCRGFLSTQWKCGLCGCSVCPDCHEVIQGQKSEHKCDPNTLESVKLISTECRQCPNKTCGTLIYKIDGCDQMFCTSCHIAFSWRTGHIENGPIHNPHYYEWQRQNNGGIAPRVAGDVPHCTILPLYHAFLSLIRKHYTLAEVKKLSDLHRFLNHVHYYVMPGYAPAHNEHNSNEDLRIKYLMNEITKDDFKKKLQIREKRKQKNRAIHQVLDVFMAVCIELINKVNHGSTKIELQAEVFDMISRITAYCNDQLKKLSRRFDCMVNIIDDTKLEMNKYRYKASDDGSFVL